MSLKLVALLGVTMVLNACSPSRQTPALKLYTLSCGEIDISNLADFSDDGSYDNKARVFADSCYLIRHPKGDLMWDAGLPDALAQTPDGVVNGVFHVTVPRTLQSQLQALDVAPNDIEFFAMSHSHFDHTGNANMFANGPTWIVDAAEHDWMFGEGPKLGATQLDSYAQLKDITATKITEDYDVFGDGSVQIIRTPGHTPGHLSLLLKLPKTGNILLTGDMYHMPESREFRRVPVFNTSKAQTLASMDKFEALAKTQNARIIIQHAQADIATLPAFPAFAE
ncbi:MBL-fold metallo-hydrolase superfamily [hydrothermal vent metagenome]|uniref:MBL-fold metallo-hydrolase superfamily n=1 Tax=hydrothermal vent metagenome TaxID=652676 RepID=A0A3B0RG97_9ZZZZ